MDFPSFELIGCHRFDEVSDGMPGHHAVPRDWHEDAFGSMLGAILGPRGALNHQQGTRSSCPMHAVSP